MSSELILQGFMVVCTHFKANSADGLPSSTSSSQNRLNRSHDLSLSNSQQLRHKLKLNWKEDQLQSQFNPSEISQWPNREGIGREIGWRPCPMRTLHPKQRNRKQGRSSTSIYFSSPIRGEEDRTKGEEASKEGIRGVLGHQSRVQAVFVDS